MKVEIGTIYEDPEGIWEVTDFDGEDYTVKCVQEGNINFGREFGAPAHEVEYYCGV